MHTSKPSELFEGENSSLRKTFEEATQKEEWEEEFDAIQAKHSYTEYTNERFCCGGDYCTGNHLDFIKDFIRTLLSHERAERDAWWNKHEQDMYEELEKAHREETEKAVKKERKRTLLEVRDMNIHPIRVDDFIKQELLSLTPTKTDKQ